MLAEVFLSSEAESAHLNGALVLPLLTGCNIYLLAHVISKSIHVGGSKITLGSLAWPSFSAMILGGIATP
jgi:hypothetical protein